MNKSIMLSTCLMLMFMHVCFSQSLVITQKDSLEILEQAGLKVMFLEASLNYLADPNAKAKDAIQKSSYEEGTAKRIFMNREILIEDDLNPGVQGSVTPPLFITSEAYLNKFREVYRSNEPKSIQFRVSKVRSLIPTEKGYYVTIFFESTFAGTYVPVTGLSYQTTNRIASLKIERDRSEWRAYITEIAFATPQQVEYFVPREYKEHMEYMEKKKEERK